MAETCNLFSRRIVQRSGQCDAPDSTLLSRCSAAEGWVLLLAAAPNGPNARNGSKSSSPSWRRLPAQLCWR